MIRSDRSIPRHVVSGVRARFSRLAATLTLVAVATSGVACSKNTEGAKEPGQNTGGGSLLDQQTPTGPIVGADSGGSTGGGTTGGTDTPDEQPVAEPEVPKREPPKPPGQDLPPAEREEIVRSRLKLGAEATRRGDGEAMIREAMGVLDVDETNVAAMVLLAHGYYFRGNLDKAEAVLTEALKQEKAKDNATLWMLFGLIYDQTDREDNALAAYVKASTSSPNYAAAWTNRGVILAKRRVFGGAEGAVACFEKVMSITGRNKSARLHNHLGAAYRGLSVDDKGRREDLLRKAEGEFKTAMTVDPNYAPAYFNLGLLYFDADPYPGLDKLQRLSMALQYLKEYQRVMGPGLKAQDQSNDYIATAQKAYDVEEKAQKRKREKEEKDRAKKAADAAKPADPAPAPEGDPK